MTLQKQKTTEPEDEKKKPSGDGPKADPKLTKAVDDGKDLLKRMDQASKKKSGRWTFCCGVQVWVED